MLRGEQGPEAGAAGTGPTHRELAERGNRRAPHGPASGARPRRAALRPALARRGELDAAHSGRRRRRRSFATLAAILPQPLSLLPLGPGGRAEAAPTPAPPPSGGLGRRLPPRAERRSYLGLASWVVGAAPVPFQGPLALAPAPAAAPGARRAAAAIAQPARSASASRPLPRAWGLSPYPHPLGRGKRTRRRPATPAHRPGGSCAPEPEPRAHVAGVLVKGHTESSPEWRARPPPPRSFLNRHLFRECEGLLTALCPPHPSSEMTLPHSRFTLPLAEPPPSEGGVKNKNKCDPLRKTFIRITGR